MKIQFISLLLVASVAMSRPLPSSPSSNAALDRRTLIGDEYAVTNQVDNSHGKKTLRVDHNGNSSVRKGFLYDLVDPSRYTVENDDTVFQFRRRSLLGGLFGGDSMSISNENDNSKHTQTKNEYDNRYTTITKIHKNQKHSNDDDEDEYDMSPESFFDKRNADTTTPSSASLDRRGLLLGGESTTINNVNDNSKHTQTMNVHNNRDTTITKLHNHQQSASSRRRHHGPRRGDAPIPKSFFDRRDDNNESHGIDRRSLLGDLFGGNSMSISNVNDNSQTKKTLNSHGNRNTRITKIHKTTKSSHGDDSNSESFFDKRGLLFGGESMVINNENDNSQTKKTLNSHGNRNTRLTRIHKSSHGSDSGSNFFNKRDFLFGDQSTTITNQNDNSQNKKTLNSHHNHNNF
ncbi:hypothetical protein BGZ47_002437 [Haplosporangium gracile]|nr:hypothetical protein BGZ47_002437 [Haplosporangium gracile]